MTKFLFSAIYQARIYTETKLAQGFFVSTSFITISFPTAESEIEKRIKKAMDKGWGDAVTYFDKSISGYRLKLVSHSVTKL